MASWECRHYGREVTVPGGVRLADSLPITKPKNDAALHAGHVACSLISPHASWEQAGCSIGVSDDLAAD